MQHERKPRKPLSDEARQGLTLANEIMDEAGIPRLLDSRPQPRMSIGQANGLALVLGVLLAPAKEELGLTGKKSRKGKAKTV